MKIAVLFAGQGAQKPGMGKSLFDADPVAREVFKAADSVMPGLTELCFSGTQEDLNKTENTQPCVFTVDVAAYMAFGCAGLTASMGAGFSLGEYAAMVSAGVIKFQDALRLVMARAGWMSEAASAHKGGMAALMGKTAEEAEQIAKEANTGGLLMPVNYNCPGQTVIAGDEQQLENLAAYAKERKIKLRRLPVSGAFHTPQMEEASNKIYDYIKDLNFGVPKFTLYANKTAQPYEQISMKRTFADQTKSPVRFEQTIRNMIDAGVDAFVEVGPGTTLTGFVKRISSQVLVYNINDQFSLMEVKDALG